MTLEQIMENKTEQVEELLVEMAGLINENAATQNFFGYREQIGQLVELNNEFLNFIDKYSLNTSIPLSANSIIANYIDPNDLDFINESSNFIMLNHLALSIADSSYESTLSFVKSRYMWNKTLSPYDITLEEFLQELNIVIADLTFGSSAMLRAKLKNEVCSEFTIKPLFKFVSLIDVFFLSFEE
jgi:hypothetical protein